MNEARKAAWKTVRAKQIRISRGDDVPSEYEFNSGWAVCAEHTAAIREKALAVFNQYDRLHEQHRIMTLTRGISNQSVHGCALCDELNSLYATLTALKAALEGNDG